MAKPSIDIAESLAGLSAATIFELRGEWRRLHRAPPPMRLSRDLLMRGITHAILQNRRVEAGNIARVPAPEIETLVCEGIRRHLAAMMVWTAPDGIDCARVRSLQISDNGDRPWNRLAELAWTRRSIFSSSME